MQILHLWFYQVTTIRTKLINDCLPTSLGGIQFTTTTGDVTYLTFTANFRFSTFEIVAQT